ncbi:response regulator [Paenarthrobacter sp. NPDC089322]|uniref:response regulator transcription factor n=1 Tax=Paenarthrobacter sp. NPDC089322 TaxID=3155065 RepID=UPI00344A9BC9
MASRRRCLVIEDDPDVGGLIEAILTQAGFDVYLRGSDEDGLSEAMVPELALITVDVGLPDMSGWEVALRLRDLTDAPILMITARLTEMDDLDAMAAGVSAFLAKPFRPTQLRALVQQLCPIVPFCP